MHHHHDSILHDCDQYKLCAEIRQLVIHRFTIAKKKKVPTVGARWGQPIRNKGVEAGGSGRGNG